MPSYYYPAQTSHNRPRAYSQSYYPSPPAAAPQVVYTSSHPSHHGASYVQPAAYYSSPQYLSPNYHHDSGRHHGHRRSGSGNVYYTSSAPTAHYTSSSHRTPTHHHTTTRRSTSTHAHTHRPSRSQSVPRQPQVVDYGYSSGHRLRRSESRPRETLTRNVSHHRRGSSSNEPLSERIRRMFGFGSSSNYRQTGYTDARTGRTVDYRGRPIYRV